MNINKVKDLINKNKGQIFMFKFKGSRNQIDEFVGKILNSYNAIFTIKVNDRSQLIKSFSYNDLLIGNLEMKEIVFKK